MAANCDVCGKGPSFGHNISHSHRRTKRRWNPNIQRVSAGRRRGRDPEAAQRLHLVPQGRQGHPLTRLTGTDRSRRSPHGTVGFAVPRRPASPFVVAGRVSRARSGPSRAGDRVETDAVGPGQPAKWSQPRGCCGHAVDAMPARLDPPSPPPRRAATPRGTSPAGGGPRRRRGRTRAARVADGRRQRPATIGARSSAESRSSRTPLAAAMCQRRATRPSRDVEHRGGAGRPRPPAPRPGR